MTENLVLTDFNVLDTDCFSLLTFKQTRIKMWPSHVTQEMLMSELKYFLLTKKTQTIL